MQSVARMIGLSCISLALILGLFLSPAPGNAQQEDEELLDIVFVATPSVVGKKDSVRLEWEAPDADYCTASDGWSGRKPPRGSEVVIPKKVKKYTYSLECFNNEGNTSDEVSANVTVLKKRPAKSGPPKGVSLRITKKKIAPGETTSLIWKSKNASACRAFGSDDWEGLKLSSGREVVSPQGTTQYSLHCWTPTGTFSDLQTVTVVVEEPLIPVEVKSGYENSFQFGGPSGSFQGPFMQGPYQQPPFHPSPSNAPTLLPPIESLPPQVITVTPTPSISTAPARVSYFRTSSKYYDQSGEPILLSWRAINAKSCNASGDWDGSRPLEGSEYVKPTKDSEYRLTCLNPESNSQDTLSVAVTKRPPPKVTGTISMTFSPARTTIAPGGSVQVVWNVYNATSCEASGGWAGAKTFVGSEVFSPQTSTTYYLDCKNDNRSLRKSLYIDVKTPQEDKSGYKASEVHSALWPQMATFLPSKTFEAGTIDALIGAFTVVSKASYDVYFKSPYLYDGDGTDGLGKALMNLRLFAEGPRGQGKQIGSTLPMLPTQTGARTPMTDVSYKIPGNSSVAFYVYADVKPDAELVGNNDRLQIGQWHEDHPAWNRGFAIGSNVMLQQYTIEKSKPPISPIIGGESGPLPPPPTATTTTEQQPLIGGGTGPLPPPLPPTATTTTEQQPQVPSATSGSSSATSTAPISSSAPAASSAATSTPPTSSGTSTPAT